MSKDALDRVADSIKKTTDDVKDTVHEATHRSAADAEKARRETFGDELSGTEKAKSHLNEAKERTEAEIDAAKRKLRDAT